MQPLRLLLFFFAIFIFSYSFAQTEQSNILLIIADDLGIDVMNGYQQNEQMPTTPNLDQLRENGLTFTNTWATPQCTPTRAAILSGKYGINTGVMRPPGNLDLEHTSLFSKIKEVTNNKYATALIGKWHISNPVDYEHPEQHGVDHYEGLFTASVDDYYDWEKVTNGEISQVEEYVTTHLTDAAIDWIKEQNQPWLLTLSHAAPHSPFHVPPAGLYSVESTSGQLNKYLAAIEAMDHEIGRLLESLEKVMLENTTIIFVGDNGTPERVLQNYPSGHAKGTLYEGGIRVPMIFSGKQVSRVGEQEDGLSQTTDLYATILELVGYQLQGGIHNSLSLKAALACEDQVNRKYNYTDYEDGNELAWAIRNEQYKLIQYEEGSEEFFDLSDNILENENLIDQLTTEQELIKEELSQEVQVIRNAWSCNDGIQNGEEAGIDDCNDTCTDDNSLSTENIGCCAMPEYPSVYYESIENDKRLIYTNDFPNHNYCFNPNLIPEPTYYLFSIDQNPQLTPETTPMVRANGRPARYFGVAKNGVIMAPAPAQPFIFENPNTGQFNWDWVFEPTNNQGNGRGLVALDCASAHTGPQGYHYHGDMYEYLENLISGITESSSVSQQIHIGWAADGFPILYRFGPDENGQLKELLPSYQLRTGERPGDGITEPCGAYNGKYTRDYEYICGKGDLDECNGLQREIIIETAEGMQTFDYFYVISATFPQIPRCLMGNVSADFDNSSPALTGIDNDGDGFLSQFDCNDDDANINPNAMEITGNEVDENCDGLLTSTKQIEEFNISISPNPSSGNIHIQSKEATHLSVQLYASNGTLLSSKKQQQFIDFQRLNAGIYILKITVNRTKSFSTKVIVQ